MKNFKPILIIDTETTGLDLEKSNIIQVAAVYVDDISKKNEDFKQINIFVKHDRYNYVEPGAVKMMANVLANAQESKDPYTAKKMWQEFYSSVNKLGNKLFLAGKNVAMFDLPLLQREGYELYNYSHRVVDVGNIYFQDFGYIPNLSEINKLLGKEEVKHDALQDCYDVVDAIRSKLNAKNTDTKV